MPASSRLNIPDVAAMFPKRTPIAAAMALERSQPQRPLYLTIASGASSRLLVQRGAPRRRS